MRKRGLSEQESLKWWLLTVVVWGAYLLCWLLPVLPDDLKPGFLRFLSGMPAISFPPTAICSSAVFLAFATALLVWMNVLHRRKGGLKETGETIIFYKEGPFLIMRHPGIFGFIAYFALLPVILSGYVGFTFLTAVGILVAVAFHYYMAYAEERYNLKKWGDEYRQYMKEVPRFNFVKGIWNLRK